MSEQSGPLPPAVERETLHYRDYRFSGHRRPDGLFDVEGCMTDRKTYAFPNEWRGTIEAGTPVHEMWVRVTLSEDFVIQSVVASTTASPFAVCADITPAFAALKGETIKSGWSNRLKEKFGGRAGCTHHVEMLRALGTVAFQTIHGWKERQRRQFGGAGPDRPPGEAPKESALGKRRPTFIDSCYALAADGDVVRRHFPDFYEGSDASSDRPRA